MNALRRYISTRILSKKLLQSSGNHSTHFARDGRALTLLAAGGGGLVLASYFCLKNYASQNGLSLEHLIQDQFFLKASAAAANIHPQPNVFSPTKNHALYLTIHLTPQAPPKECAKVMARLQVLVDKICPPDLRDESDEMWAGVGFGPNFLARIRPDKPAGQSFLYPHRKGLLGEMPSTGGDIFIHAKSHQISKLFELVQSVLRSLPKGSVAQFEDVYGWVYREGRDLSGFIDGTENPADEEDRRRVAVDKMTGGSYAITQKWIHDLPLIETEKDRVMEGWIGRTRPDSTELSRKPATSHVARMTGGTDLNQTKKHEIVRQSQPFGSVSGQAGLFFIGYSATPVAFDWMLDRMVGASSDGLHDDVMRLTRCVTGAYWYFPGVGELEQLI